MSSTLETRKPIDELTASDLKAFAVWEFAEDEEGAEEQDETWVRPVEGQLIPLNRYAMTVAARFKTHSGAGFDGMVSVSTDEGVLITHGALLRGDRRLLIPPSGFPGESAMREDLARSLGLKGSELFPLHYELLAVIENESEPRAGRYL